MSVIRSNLYCEEVGSVDNSNIVQYTLTLRPAACPRDPVQPYFGQ